MTTTKKIHLRIIPGMMILIFILSACGFGSFLNKDGETDPTPTINLLNGSDGDIEILSTPIDQEINEQNQEPETITVFRLDGTEEVVPRVYSSFSDLLESKVEKGEWTQSEGLVELLRYFSFEIDIEDLDELEYVHEKSGSGLVRLAREYIAENPQDIETVNELNRLLAQFLPSEEVLDLISIAAPKVQFPSKAKNAMIKKQTNAAACANLERLGFDPSHFEGEPCYIFVLEQHNGMNYRVYYPSEWQGNQVKTDAVKVALSALIASAKTFSQYGGFYNINMTISLNEYSVENNEKALAIQHPISGRSTCPITLFKLSGSVGMDNLKQTIAHEAFHCFQDWNAPYGEYDPNEWWIEGSAEYFSNVVYPTINYEHENLSEFDSDSIKKPIHQMNYQNFLFFQHLGNVYGEKEVINLLKSLATTDGAITTLAAYDNMANTFQDFVVAYMSTGIQDSGGGMILVENPAVIKTEIIDTKKEEKFSIQPFVSGRFRMNFKQENRFLQSPKEDGNGKYSTAEFDLRKDLTSWSSLPPEIRTKCNEDILYALVVTTTETSGQFNFIANIEKVEKAECDPCLLGVWQIDNDSFENYILGAMASQGGVEGFPPGSELFMEVEGAYLMEFKENSDLLSRRDNLSVTTGATGYPGFTSVIDSQGTGSYSTRDGKQLDFFDMNDYVNQVQAFMNGVPFSVNLMPGGGTYNVFGQTDTLPAEGYENSNEQASLSVNYVCNDETLTITHPEYGDLLLKRVEKIMPTPIPTLSP